MNKYQWNDKFTFRTIIFFDNWQWTSRLLFQVSTGYHLLCRFANIRETFINYLYVSYLLYIFLSRNKKISGNIVPRYLNEYRSKRMLINSASLFLLRIAQRKRSKSKNIIEILWISRLKGFFMHLSDQNYRLFEKWCKDYQCRNKNILDFNI